MFYFTDNPDEKPVIRDIKTLWNNTIKNNYPLYLPISEDLSEIRRMQSRVMQETRSRKDQIRENIDSESFMGGIVEFVYESTPTQMLHTAVPLAAVG